MQVLHRLACVFADVGNQAVAVGKTEHLRDFRNGGQQFRNCAGVRFVNGICRRDVHFRYDKAVHRCLRMNVEKRVADIVLVHFFRGNLPFYDGTKKTIHVFFLSFTYPMKPV